MDQNMRQDDAREDAREKERTLPEVPVLGSRFSKKKLLLGFGLVLSVVVSAAFGSVIAISNMPKSLPQTAAVETEEQDNMPEENFRPVRGIDLAREKELPTGQTGFIPMEYTLSKRGMATEHFLFDILDPEAERELHRPMVPRLIASTSLEREASDVSSSLVSAGGLGEFEPMIDRPMPANAQGRSEISYPEVTEKSEPRMPPSDVVPSAASPTFPPSRYEITPRSREDAAGVEIISPFRD